MRKEYEVYPSAEEIDEWVADLFAAADKHPVKAEIIDPDLFEWPESNNLPYRYAARHHEGAAYVRFSGPAGPKGNDGKDVFYAFWQPSYRVPAPLLIHVPGYGAEMSAHPELVTEGYNVLHINPLGYCTPEGMDGEKTSDTADPLAWPQLPETIMSRGEKGYRQWFIDCIRAVTWAFGQSAVLPGRFSFFGTSQGGGAALILASMYRDRGVRSVAADVPFLTDYPLAEGRGAYEIVRRAIGSVEDREKAWHALGYVDTISHAHRLLLPVLLTSGGMDEMCPPETVKSLYDRLQCTRSLTVLTDREHAYTPEFLYLCYAWFGMYA